MHRAPCQNKPFLVRYSVRTKMSLNMMTQESRAKDELHWNDDIYNFCYFFLIFHHQVCINASMYKLVFMHTHIHIARQTMILSDALHVGWADWVCTDAQRCNIDFLHTEPSVCLIEPVCTNVTVQYESHRRTHQDAPCCITYPWRKGE